MGSKVNSGNVVNLREALNIEIIINQALIDILMSKGILAQEEPMQKNTIQHVGYGVGTGITGLPKQAIALRVSFLPVVTHSPSQGHSEVIQISFKVF